MRTRQNNAPKLQRAGHQIYKECSYQVLPASYPAVEEPFRKGFFVCTTEKIEVAAQMSLLDVLVV
ncbi:hypothetical protein D3C76_1410520 [compost metagenome]